MPKGRPQSPKLICSQIRTWKDVRVGTVHSYCKQQLFISVCIFLRAKVCPRGSYIILKKYINRNTKIQWLCRNIMCFCLARINPVHGLTSTQQPQGCGCLHTGHLRHDMGHLSMRLQYKEENLDSDAAFSTRAAEENRSLRTPR